MRFSVDHMRDVPQGERAALGHACVAIGYKYDSQTKELLGIRFYNPATGQLEECEHKKWRILL